MNQINSEVFTPDPHRDRRRALLKNHPEIAGLVGRDSRTAGWIAVVVTAQVALAGIAGLLPTWAMFALAWGVGAFAALALWTLVHECSHDLVLGSAKANRMLGIAASLPLVLPVGAAFRTYHLLHHRHPGHAIYDVDVPAPWEARAVGSCPLRKSVWLAANPLLQSLRTARIRDVPMVDRWFVLNLAVQIAFDAAVGMLLGWQALAYLFASNCFALGLHPLGARFVQEHCTLREGQETTSYYGSANRLVFNAGYHNEHHDVARIPWSRLPALRAAAPEFYDTLHAETSWSRLLLRFLTDKSLRIDSRVVRGEVG
ncbi:Fatty acid desaturase [Tsuneonella dongtanensis]|uniref:Fatty acid desaturase n=1 Tax=Tsuneonella dongtanensis TaxID=692370 RepID=A0A1B2ACZ7_9SPHN|nr:fatty acid desaturase [Tsuneonella dongtanensis]ANY19994.1 Fatty acid desaturase [Tsuneonella dongtanensis]